MSSLEVVDENRNSLTKVNAPKLRLGPGQDQGYQGNVFSEGASLILMQLPDTSFYNPSPWEGQEIQG